MAAPYSDVRDKSDRAVVAYLKAQGVCENVYPARFSGTRALPNLTVQTLEGEPIAPPLHISRCPVHITSKSAAAQQPGEVNPELQRVEAGGLVSSAVDALAFDDIAARVTAAGRALAVSDGTPEGDQQAENDSDMADFTCQSFMFSGFSGGQPDEAAVAWLEGVMFDAVSYPEVV